MHIVFDVTEDALGLFFSLSGFLSFCLFRHLTAGL